MRTKNIATGGHVRYLKNGYRAENLIQNKVLCPVFFGALSGLNSTSTDSLPDGLATDSFLSDSIKLYLAINSLVDFLLFGKPQSAACSSPVKPRSIEIPKSSMLPTSDVSECKDINNGNNSSRTDDLLAPVISVSRLIIVERPWEAPRRRKLG